MWRGGGLGYGQNWYDVTASRLAGTNYTNTTGKPIYASVQFYLGSTGSAAMIVDVVIIPGSSFNGAGGAFAVAAIIPNGSTYMAYKDTAGSLYRWSELR